MTESFTPVSAAVRAWTAAWSARDPDTLLKMWDADDAEAIYLPAEKTAPLKSLSDISEYVTITCTLFTDIRHRAEHVITRQIAGNTGLAFYSLAWMVKDGRGPVGGTCRVTSVWRQRGAEWRCCHYAEAPLAPLLELQHYYEAVAEDGFEAIPART